MFRGCAAGQPSVQRLCCRLAYVGQAMGTPPVGHRDLSEFDFRHNNRKLSDAERAEELLRGAKGKRLLYRQPDEAPNG